MSNFKRNVAEMYPDLFNVYEIERDALHELAFQLKEEKALIVQKNNDSLFYGSALVLLSWLIYFWNAILTGNYTALLLSAFAMAIGGGLVIAGQLNIADIPRRSLVALKSNRQQQSVNQ